jgi:uncharacterized damage-inducible protein DinB
MPGLAPPVTDERNALHEFIAYLQHAYFGVAYGLTDEQARSTPAASALSIGALIKHATGVQRTWMARVAAAPQLPPADTRSQQERAAEFQNDFLVGEDETVDVLLERFAAQNAETLRLLDNTDLDTPVPIPGDVPWFPKDIDAWSVRWVFNHLINELARHAGQADIIRETIDGATLYDLLAGLEGWPETEWIKPWRPGEVRR